MVWTNDVAYSYGGGPAPWGGRKESGYGRTHSMHGLYECSSVKLVDADGGHIRVPWWYPYSPRAVEGFKGVLGVLHGDGAAARARALWTNRAGFAYLTKRYLGR